MKPVTDSGGVLLPNFLVVGAGKSGTTSLYHYLKAHPDVFMSRIKEPGFVVAQFIKMPQSGVGDERQSTVGNFSDYCRLFEDAEGKKAVGEASNDNLYHYERAIPYIKRFFGDIKIIIILRNPVDRAFSAYTYLLRDNREFLTFEEALREEKKRQNENWRYIWYYRDAGLYYEQVKAYMESFHDVRVCLFDDLVKDPLTLVRSLYDFLSVDPSFSPDVSSSYNISGIPRSKLLNNFFISKGRLQAAIRTVGTFVLNDDNWIKLRESFRAKLLIKPGMKPETRKYLQSFYKKNIIMLQALINRDLKEWLED